MNNNPVSLPFNIYLIGFMGCGKTSAAEYMKKTYGMPVIEMDQRIAADNEMSVSEIFRQKGEPYFRRLETELLKKLLKSSNHVISCGGGVPMRDENVRIMKSGGKVILLTATPETILRRTSGSHDRPLLEGRKTIEGITSLMESRRPAYEKAADIKVVTDGRTEKEICEEIIRSVLQQ